MNEHGHGYVELLSAVLMFVAILALLKYLGWIAT